MYITYMHTTYGDIHEKASIKKRFKQSFEDQRVWTTHQDIYWRLLTATSIIPNQSGCSLLVNAWYKLYIIVRIIDIKICYSFITSFFVWNAHENTPSTFTTTTRLTKQHLYLQYCVRYVYIIICRMVELSLKSLEYGH